MIAFHDQRGARGQRPSHRDALLLATGQLGGRSVLEPSQAHEFQTLGDPLRSALRFPLRSALRQVEQAIAGRNAEALRQATHSLKSSTASIGAVTLAGLFRELEALAKAARMDDALVVLGAVRLEYERVLVALRDLLAEAP